MKTGVFGHSIEPGPGNPEMTGAVTSAMIVMALEVAGFPVGQEIIEVNTQVIHSPLNGVKV